jgi:hypothetical protein
MTAWDSLYSLLDYECLLFRVTDMVLIYESVTSSASTAEHWNLLRLTRSESESESYVTTDGQPASLSWNKAPILGLRPDLYYLCDNYGLVLVGRPLW